MSKSQFHSEWPWRALALVFAASTCACVCVEDGGIDMHRCDDLGDCPAPLSCLEGFCVVTGAGIDSGTDPGSDSSVACDVDGGTFAPCDWSYRRRLTFDNPSGAEVLTDFPVLAALDAMRIDYTSTSPGGADLRFTDSDGVTLLSHEIETWDESGISHVWVKVPIIDAMSASDHIWMYYGNVTATDGQDPQNVWDATHLGVWHLNEDPTNTAPQFFDSTANANHAHARGSMPSGALMPGLVGGGLSFDGADDYAEIAHDDDYLVDDGTLMLWLRTTSPPGVDQALWSKDASGFLTGGHLTIRITNLDLVNVRLQSTSASNTISSSAIVTDTWYLVAFTFSIGGMDLYLDGSPVASDAYAGGLGGTSGDIGNFEPIAIAAGTSGSNAGVVTPTLSHLEGQIDEIRFSGVARSAEWIVAEYRSMTDAFIQYGPEEAVTP